MKKWLFSLDYETLRVIEVLQRSRTLWYCCSRAIQLNPLTASELCQHHSPWRRFWPDDYPQVFGDSIGKFDGELHLYTSNNVIPHKSDLRETPLCVSKTILLLKCLMIIQRILSRIMGYDKYVKGKDLLIADALSRSQATNHWGTKQDETRDWNDQTGSRRSKLITGYLAEISEATEQDTTYSL